MAVARLEFPRETGLILRCAGKAGNPFQTTHSHEIKRRLLLGKNVMTNLDSILKSRDIALPTKVHLVKAMVFPKPTRRP